MRRLFSLTLFITFSLSLQAQYEEILLPVNEISFNVFSLKNWQVVDDGPNYYPYFFQGVSYKRMINDHILRFGFNFFQKLDEHQDPKTLSTGNFKEIELGFGYQRIFFESLVKPYVAADFVILNSTSLKVNESIPAENFREEKDIRKFGLGVSPIVGVRFETKTALSFSLETSLQLIMIWERGTIEYWEPDIVPTYTDVVDSGFDTRWNPVAGLFLTLKF
ncbi:MAG: hypothetical protein U9N53_10565 [Bacteroidota bacterium]|nr:hypothetical protein [Bacteroidota bacterium]